jgi:hypothetical protein
MRSVTTSLDNGLWEMFFMVITFLLSSRKLSGKWTFAVFLLVCGYGFAWVGHFAYEKNTPATFIYPAYSLMGDFLLWKEVLTLERPF